MSETKADWRPIETAPRDGTAIIVWLEGEIMVVRRVVEIPHGEWWEPTEHLLAEVLGAVEDERIQHWMPLPAPPAPTKGV